MRIGIAGAGLCGRLLAWQLARQGHSVTLFDRDSGAGEQSAGLIAAAMLAPYSESLRAGNKVFQLGCRALRQWQGLLSLLCHDTGVKVELRHSGSIAVAHRADALELDDMSRRLQSLPAVDLQRPYWLSASELRAAEPELDNFERGLYLPGEGCLDNRALFAALGQAIDKAGGRWRRQQQVETVGAGFIRSGGASHRFDYVFDCRGFGAGPELKELRGVRGELLWVRATEVKLSRPVRLMHPRYQIYIAPKPDHFYVVGATEIESESLAPITVRSALELQSALYTLHTGFAEAEIVQASSQCRPAFEDNLPRIYQAEGLMRVNGLYRHGYLLGPTLVARALALFENRAADPGSGSLEEAIKVVPA
ncbi:MAG: glycine oxidase ThiO [Gammaproteobacteria bacterium]|nr:glycine oxidase ThiO [Gammaproteobacteria bacterium]